jgi:hypothetical protein
MQMATSSTSLSMVDNSQLDYPVLLTALVAPSLWLTQANKRTLRLVSQSLKVFLEEWEVLLMLSLPLDNKRINLLNQLLLLDQLLNVQSHLQLSLEITL